MLENVVKTYRAGSSGSIRAVDQVSLRIASGESAALVGASGSGKSTLLHLIGGMDLPDSGTVRVGDRTVSGLRRAALADCRATVGFVFQQFHLIPALSLLDNVAAPMIGRSRRRDRERRARELLETVGLGERVNALPSQLSGGQQQRVAIARALVAEPRIILADEPTGNLDSATAAEIIALLRSVQRDAGVTLVVATHDLSVARGCDQAWRVHDGHASAAADVAALGDSGQITDALEAAGP